MIWTSRKVGERNQLHGIMQHQIKCSLPGFFAAREWCWQQFGPGIEYEHWHNYAGYAGIQMPWAWDCSKFQGSSISSGKLYLRTDEDLALFSSRWTV